MHQLSFFIALVFGGCTNAFATSSFEHRCDKELPKTNIVFQTIPITFTVFSHVPARILSERSTYTHSSEKLLGMTENKSVLEIHFDGAILEDKKQAKECLSPQIKVVLRYEPLKVYIARELPQGSCSYRVMYAHEMDHVQVYQEQFSLLFDKVRKELMSRLGEQKIYGGIGQAKDLLAQEIDNRWRPFIRDELSKVEKMQRGVDSNEEIARLSNSCFGDTARLMGSLY